MICLCRRIGLLALSDHTQHGRIWLVPTRLPFNKAPSNSLSVEDETRSTAWQTVVRDIPNVDVLLLTVPIGPILPASVFERLTAMCSTLGTPVELWSGGAHFYLQAGGSVDGQGSIHVRLQMAGSTMGAVGPRYHKLVIECCADRDMRPVSWAFAVQIRGHMRSILDDFPSLRVHQHPAMLTCPGCTARAANVATEGGKAAGDMTLWTLEAVIAASQKCEVCGDKVSLQTAKLLEEPSPPTSLILPDRAVRARSSVADTLYCLDEMRYGTPLEALSSLEQLLGLASVDNVDNLRVSGERAILDEFEAEAGRASAWSDVEKGEYGWSELDWCVYLSAGSFKADALPTSAEGSAMARAERAVALHEEACTKGLIDVGRDDPTLEWFLKHNEVAHADLSKGHLLALRLITSPVAAKINCALHNGCDVSRPHPYPATCILAFDGLSKLWSTQLGMRHSASKAAIAAAELAHAARLGGEEETIATSDAAYKKAAAASEALKIGALWQASCRVNSEAFKVRGGTAMGFSHFSDNREAQGMANMQRLFHADQVTAHSSGLGATATLGETANELIIYHIEGSHLAPVNLSFLSPLSTAAFCLPPGTYFEQRKESTEWLQVGEAQSDQIKCKIVELTLHLPPFIAKQAALAEQTRAVGKAHAAHPNMGTDHKRHGANM